MASNSKRQDLKETLLDKFKTALRTGTAQNLSTKASNWFRAKIQKGKQLAKQTYNRSKAGMEGGLKGIKPIDMFRRGGYDRRKFTGKKVVYGKMFFFEYDAKYKATLPYWDRFPLTIFFDFSPPHIIGLNLHYLSPYMRAGLMDKLNKFRNKKESDSGTFLRLNWKQIARIPEVKPAVKKYLINRVKMAVQVPADEWDIAIFMPVARFQKASEAEVYKDSKQMVAKR
tara:strand:+ start:361 stop:1041 length:681 start_codon:yes stop_codon:yes gene_type:complete